MTFRTPLARRCGAAALATTALLLSACGSSSGSNSSSSQSSASQASAATRGAYGSAAPAAATSSKVSIGTTTGSGGTYLTGTAGRALYLWVADGHDQSACSGACAKVWPPVTAASLPAVSGAARASKLGTITRSDGAKQVTYQGHPLYYYVSDSTSGMIHGQGSDSFGAKWWLVTPSGTAITGG
jgi:predicted lipoprotein with Yx(FWY)xxD motif